MAQFNYQSFCYLNYMYPQAREYLQNKLSDVATKYNTVSFYVTESQTRVPVVIAHYLNGYQEVGSYVHCAGCLPMDNSSGSVIIISSLPSFQTYLYFILIIFLKNFWASIDNQPQSHFLFNTYILSRIMMYFVWPGT
jgi:hypothetical protein